MAARKLFKYIDDVLHGYLPVSTAEQQELEQDGWNSDASQAYENRGKYPAVSDNDFRVDIEALKRHQIAQQQH